MADDTPCSHAELAQLRAELVAFKELMNERDRRYELRSNGQDNAVAAVVEASKESVTKAEIATEKRLASLNEFREMAMDQAETFAREDKVALRLKAIADQQHVINSSIDSRFKPLEAYLNSQTGRGVGVNAVWAFIVTSVTCFVGVATLITAIVAITRIP